MSTLTQDDTRQPTAQVLVAQIGARRRYAVPRALAQAGCLRTLVTDACDGIRPWVQLKRLIPRPLRPASLRAALDRHLDGVSTEIIQGCFGLSLSCRLGPLRPRRNEARTLFWLRQNHAFARAVANTRWPNVDTVYAFNGAALEIFQRARELGIRCILDQTAAPWRFNTELLRREKARWNEWEECPQDMDVTGEMSAREEAEWTLADRIICGSHFVVDALRRQGGPYEKCVVVPYPLPVVPEPQVPRPSLQHRRLRVLFGGTLQLRKGIQYVWDVARILENECDFRAIGQSHLTKQADQWVSERLDWHGHVERNQVWRHYQWADIFLLPTLSEGSANACWEALAAGTTVVATAAAGLNGFEASAVSADSDVIVSRLTQLSSSQPAISPRVMRSRTVTEYGSDLVRAML